MKELNKYFDHYTINARFKPVFFTLLPFVLTMFAWCPEVKTLGGGILTLSISFGVMTFLSGFISNLGNKKQDELFTKWQGAPSTNIIRHNDSIIDKYTKERYRQWLDQEITDFNMPTREEEQEQPDDADHKYRSATNFLREFTRDKKKFPAIYRDNVIYGFSRNLLSIRVFGFLLSALCMLINSVLLINNLIFANRMTSGFESTYLGVGAVIISFIFIFIFAFIVNDNFVKARAYRYAKSLYETCEIS